MARIKVYDPTTGTWVYADTAIGQPGPQGPQGPAYTLTTADKNTIVSAVKAAMPTITVTGIDADGVSHSWTMYGVAQ